MSISSVQSSSYENYVYPSGRQKNDSAGTTVNNRSIGPDTVSFSEEALTMAQQLSTQPSAAEMSAASPPADGKSKSMYALLMESLFIAELEDSGAIGSGNADPSTNEPQSGQEEVSRAQPVKATSVNPLEDGGKVAQIKKTMSDFAKGKADITDIATAVGGNNKGGGTIEGGKTVQKIKDDNEKTIG